MERQTKSQQILFQFPLRILPGADHHIIDRQQLRFAVADNMQAIVVNALIAYAAPHLYPMLLQAGAVDPAGGFRQPGTGFALFALQQPDLTCMPGLRSMPHS